MEKGYRLQPVWLSLFFFFLFSLSFISLVLRILNQTLSPLFLLHTRSSQAAMASSEARSFTPTVNLVSPHRVPLLLGISLSSSGLDLALICDFVAAVDGSIFLGPVGGGWVGLVGVWADGCGTRLLVFGGSVSAGLVDLRNGMFQIWCGWWWLPLCEMVRIFYFKWYSY